MWQRIHPDGRDRVWEAVQEAVRQKRDLISEFRPDGTVKWVEGTSYHIFDFQQAQVPVLPSPVLI